MMNIKINLPIDIQSDLIEFTLDNYPNECCGFLFEDNTKFVPLEPEIQTVGSFYLQDSMKLLKIIKENGWPSAFFHSHPCAAYPSSVDVQYMNYMLTWAKVYKKPEIPWLILGNDFRYMSWVLGQ